MTNWNYKLLLLKYIHFFNLHWNVIFFNSEFLLIKCIGKGINIVAILALPIWKYALYIFLCTLLFSNTFCFHKKYSTIWYISEHPLIFMDIFWLHRNSFCDSACGSLLHCISDDSVNIFYTKYFRQYANIQRAYKKMHSCILYIVYNFYCSFFFEHCEVYYIFYARKTFIFCWKKHIYTRADRHKRECFMMKVYPSSVFLTECFFSCAFNASYILHTALNITQQRIIHRCICAKIAFCCIYTFCYVLTRVYHFLKLYILQRAVASHFI